MSASHRSLIAGNSAGQHPGSGRLIMAAEEWCCMETRPLFFRSRID